MNLSPKLILAGSLLLIGSAAFAQEQRPPADPGAVEPRPPMPRDEFRRPEPPPAVAPRSDQRPFEPRRPRGFRADREQRPEAGRQFVGPRGPGRSEGERRMICPEQREMRRPGMAAREREYRPMPPRFDDSARRPAYDFRPETRGERREAFRSEEPRREEFREFAGPRRDFRPVRPPMPPEQNYRNPAPPPALREFAPMARGPRPEMVRPRERGDEWERRAPRFPRREGREAERPMNPVQPLPFQ